MRTTPRSFYHLFVRPNFWDFQKTPDDARLGFNAAVSAFQLADIFHAFYTREDLTIIKPWLTIKSLLIHLSTTEPHFLTVQSVATVYKHLYARGGHYEVGSPGAIWGLTLPSEGVNISTDWGAETADVLVHKRDGSVASLTQALDRVVEHMWPNFLPDEERFDDGLG